MMSVPSQILLDLHRPPKPYHFDSWPAIPNLNVKVFFVFVDVLDVG